jgi:hypothetical protein
MEEQIMRYAIVYNITSRQQLEAYLPANYEVVPNTLTTTPDGKVRIGIRGEDVAGWTLEDYVAPRLLSGVMTVHEVRTEEQVYSGTVGVMN